MTTPNHTTTLKISDGQAFATTQHIADQFRLNRTAVNAAIQRLVDTAGAFAAENFEPLVNTPARWPCNGG